MLAARQLAEVDAVLGEFCRREPDASIREELRYAFRVEGGAVTLFERRPAFGAEVGWTESWVARFGFNGAAGT